MQSVNNIAADAILEAFGIDDAPKPSDAGFWQKHCDRYHPEGIQEGCSCKYIKEIKAKGNAASNQENKTDESKDYAKTLENEFRARPIRYETRKSLEDEILDEDIISGICNNTEPTSESDFHITLKATYEVLSDLKKRFPNFEVRNLFIIPAKMRRQKGMGGALSSVDRLKTYDAYIAISKNDDIPFTGVCFGHDDERYFSDRLRHEIGHFLSSAKIVSKFVNVSKAFIKIMGEKNFFKEIERLVSKGATANIFEGVAELFSVVSSPDYKKGTLPKPYEDIVLKDMLQEEE